MKAFEPWGRGGAGAPLRDDHGNLISKATLISLIFPNFSLHLLKCPIVDFCFILLSDHSFNFIMQYFILKY